MEFFLAFIVVYKELITAQNAQAGFRGAGLVLFNPQVVLLKLDVRLRTPIPPRAPSSNADPWISQTPLNPIKALL